MASSTTTVPAGISSQCRRTDRLLWEAYGRSGDLSEIPDRCRLFFPMEHEGKKLRVSEQEARFAFVEALRTGGRFRYSVETPTRKRYQFKGKKATSAQTDLTLRDLDTGCRRCNVEFKEGGWSIGGEGSNGSGESTKSNVFPIYKDVLKLMREPVWGLWFHLLESANSATIRNLLEVIREQIREVREGKYKDDIEAKGLTLHLCVLKHGLSLQKDVPLSIVKDDSRLEGHLRVDLELLQGELRVNRPNGWKLNQRKCKPK